MNDKVNKMQSFSRLCLWEWIQRMSMKKMPEANAHTSARFESTIVENKISAENKSMPKGSLLLPKRDARDPSYFQGIPSVSFWK